MPIQQAAAAFFPSLPPMSLLRSLHLFFCAHFFLICHVIYMSSPMSRWAVSAWKLSLGEVVAAGLGRCVNIFVCVKVTQRPPLHSGPIVHVSLYNTSTLLHAALLLHHSLSLQPLPILPTHTLMYTHTHTYKHISNCWLCFTAGRDHSFFPGREACHELCSSKPRALATAACDAATNSVQHPPAPHPNWNILLLCLLLRWE